MRMLHNDEPMGSSSEGFEERDPGFVFTVGERELRTAPLTTNEESARVWQEPWTVRAIAGRGACEDICAAVAETVGDGLCSQGSCASWLATGTSCDGG